MDDGLKVNWFHEYASIHHRRCQTQAISPSKKIDLLTSSIEQLGMSYEYFTIKFKLIKNLKLLPICIFLCFMEFDIFSLFIYVFSSYRKEGFF